MKKRNIVIILAIILLLITCMFIIFKKHIHRQYVSYDGIMLSISDGNGGILSNVPSQGEYEVTVDCTNAEGSWDYYNWKLVLKNITGNTSCDLSFRAVNPTSLANRVISLAGTTQGTGQVVNENGYRYEGKDPNNYVWFNNELWRIIGVFGSNRHGVSNTNLVKIIRNESIGSYTYNSLEFDNDYANSSIYRMLNGCYYNALTGTDTTNVSGSSVACSNYCLGTMISASSKPTANCDFSQIGIQNSGENYSYRDLVQQVTWYLGGMTDDYEDFPLTYPAVAYNYETNSSNVLSGHSLTKTGYVGLMYVSDYGYSALASSCPRGSNNMQHDYIKSVCSGNSWIYSLGYQMTIAPDNSGSEGSWIINYGGNMYGEDIYYGVPVHPVVYLKAKTYVLGGTGTKTDPYIIGKEYEYENTFNYSANVQTVQIAKAGYYKLEVYGAAGGTYNSATPGGAGGYAKGTIHLNKNDTLYIHTGGKGSYGSSTTMTTKNGGGTNGGGNASYRGGGGGGATDIRINTDSLYARVIVGGGGGGSYYYNGTYKAAGGKGGGTSGSDGAYYNSSYTDFIGKGGTSYAGGAGGTGSNTNYSGTAGSFGNGGASGRAYSTSYYSGGGGGGGWFGGGGAGNFNGQYRGSAAGGGGGSSYTYTSSTASQCPSGCLLNSNYYMTSTSTTAGSNSGDGYAKVTYCGQSASDCS